MRVEARRGTDSVTVYRVVPVSPLEHRGMLVADRGNQSYFPRDPDDMGSDIRTVRPITVVLVQISSRPFSSMPVFRIT